MEHYLRFVGRSVSSTINGQTPEFSTQKLSRLFFPFTWGRTPVTTNPSSRVWTRSFYLPLTDSVSHTHSPTPPTLHLNTCGPQLTPPPFSLPLTSSPPTFTTHPGRTRLFKPKRNPTSLGILRGCIYRLLVVYCRPSPTPMSDLRGVDAPLSDLVETRPRGRSWLKNTDPVTKKRDTLTNTVGWLRVGPRTSRESNYRTTGFLHSL